MSHAKHTSVDEVMKLYPGPIRLTQRRWPAIAMLVVSCAGTVICLLLAFPGIDTADPQFTRDIQILMGCVFALCGVVGIVASSRRLRRPNTLVLDAKGFQATGFSSYDAFAWQDVENFHIRSDCEGPSWVACELIDRDGHGRRRRQEYRLKDCGESLDALLTLMERWRDAALSRRKPPRSKNRPRG